MQFRFSCSTLSQMPPKRKATPNPAKLPKNQHSEPSESTIISLLDDDQNESVPVRTKRQRSNPGDSVKYIDPTVVIDISNSQSNSQQPLLDLTSQPRTDNKVPSNFKHLIKKSVPSNSTSILLPSNNTKSRPRPLPTKPLKEQSCLINFSTANHDDLLSPYINYNITTHIPNPLCDQSKPQFLSLRELSATFLVLAGCLSLDADDIYSYIDACYRPQIPINNPPNQKSVNLSPQGEIDSQGFQLYSQLIQIPPEQLYLDASLLNDLVQGQSRPQSMHLSATAQSLTNPSAPTHAPLNHKIDSKNLIKQADKYGDYDGMCSYCDYLNITRTCGIWIDLNFSLYEP